MPAITISIPDDCNGLRHFTDEYLSTLWHVAQANPAPFGDRDACRTVERVGREIIRRFLAATATELWHFQGEHINSSVGAVSAEPIQPAPAITLEAPELNEGEIYMGVIASADGSRRHRLILLPGELKEATWPSAMDWAASIGGELPDRVESGLLFATQKEQFSPEWYWLREQHASDSEYAWIQYFSNGYQSLSLKNIKLRARAVRRSPI